MFMMLVNLFALIFCYGNSNRAEVVKLFTDKLFVSQLCFVSTASAASNLHYCVFCVVLSVLVE